jgi:F0F1-type ATP synthase membrane subunit a
MENPRLIEPSVKHYLFDTLHRCREHKAVIYGWVFNIGLFVIIMLVLGIVLFFCRKRKLTPYEKDMKMQKEQEYILSKIRQYQTDVRNRPSHSTSSITNLPTTRDNI